MDFIENGPQALALAHLELRNKICTVSYNSSKPEKSKSNLIVVN